MMRKVNPFYEVVTYRATLPHRTGLPPGMIGCGVELGPACVVSELLAHVDRLGLHSLRAGGRRLIKPAFLSDSTTSHSFQYC